MAGFYNCLIFWNGRTLQFKLVMPACKTMAGFINCFPLVFYVYLTKLHRNVYILSTVGVIFVGRLVCSVNVLYMELSYTGSLDQSTRASEHVTVQISLPIRLLGWHVSTSFDLLEWEHVTQFKLIIPVRLRLVLLIVSHKFCFHVYLLTKLHRNVYILSTVGVIFVGRLVCSVNVLYMELSYTGSLDRSTKASSMSQFRLVYP